MCAKTMMWRCRKQGLGKVKDWKGDEEVLLRWGREDGVTGKELVR